MDLTSWGKAIVLLGVGLVVLGGLVWLAGRLGLPLGRLPGDIRIDRPGFSCFFPAATMIVISLLLTVVLNIIVRLLNR